MLLPPLASCLSHMSSKRARGRLFFGEEIARDEDDEKEGGEEENEEVSVLNQASYIAWCTLRGLRWPHTHITPSRLSAEILSFKSETRVSTIAAQVGDEGREDENVVVQHAILRSLATGGDQVLRKGRRKVVVGIVSWKCEYFTANELAPISRLETLNTPRQGFPLLVDLFWVQLPPPPPITLPRSPFGVLRRINGTSSVV